MFFRKFFGLAFMVLVIGGLIALGYSLGASAAGGAAGPLIAPALRTVLLVIAGVWLFSFLVGGIFRFRMARRWRRYGGHYRGGWGHYYKHKGRIPSGEGFWEWRNGEPEAKKSDNTEAKDAPAAV